MEGAAVLIAPRRAPRTVRASYLSFLSIPGGCKVWAGSGSRLLAFLRLSLAWRP